MNRWSTYCMGPEAAMGALTLLVYWFCGRHNSYSRSDVDLLEKMIWLLPVVAVALTFATVFVAGSKNWWWLGRANVALLIALLVCSFRIVDGFGAPGSGPKGQDVGVAVAMMLGLVFASLANTIVGAMILAEHKPAFAQWFRAHKFFASLLTVLAALPLGMALALLGGIGLGIVVGLMSVFKR